MAGGSAVGAYCPWRDLASRPHLAFVVTRLPVADGWYLPDVPGIVLDDRLTRVQRRCVLAHELAHIDLGHHQQVAGNGPGTDRLARRNEAAADRLAARRLLPLTGLMHWLPYASSRSEAAELLDVTERLLSIRLEQLSSREAAALGRLIDAVMAAA
jgi:Zn-dependent peptidase ImmA (M78 family)